MKKIISIVVLAFVCLSLSAQNITSLSNAISNSSADVWEVLRLANIERVKSGCHILVTTDVMQLMADIRAKELISYYNHDRPDGRSCFSIMQDYSFHYTSAAENIAMGQQSSAAVMTAWMNSTGHRTNLLNGNLRLMGVGMADSGAKKHWVQLFATDNNTEAVSASFTDDGSFVIFQLKNGMVAYAPYDPSILIDRGGKKVLNYPSSSDIVVTFDGETLSEEESVVEQSVQGDKVESNGPVEVTQPSAGATMINAIPTKENSLQKILTIIKQRR